MGHHFQAPESLMRNVSLLLIPYVIWIWVQVLGVRCKHVSIGFINFCVPSFVSLVPSTELAVSDLFPVWQNFFLVKNFNLADYFLFQPKKLKLSVKYFFFFKLGFESFFNLVFFKFFFLKLQKIVLPNNPLPCYFYFVFWVNTGHI